MEIILLIVFAITSTTCEVELRARDFDARINHIEKAIERAEDGKRELFVNPVRAAVKQAKLDAKIARKKVRLQIVKDKRDGKNNRRFFLNSKK